MGDLRVRVPFGFWEVWDPLDPLWPWESWMDPLEPIAAAFWSRHCFPPQPLNCCLPAVVPAAGVEMLLAAAGCWVGPAANEEPDSQTVWHCDSIATALTLDCGAPC